MLDQLSISLECNVYYTQYPQNEFSDIVSIAEIFLRKRTSLLIIWIENGIFVTGMNIIIIMSIMVSLRIVKTCVDVMIYLVLKYHKGLN